MDMPLPALFSAKLLHFVAIYRFGNLRLAAECLSMSQPAMSKSLKNLESELDVTLFLRSKSGMVPTRAADFLARQVERFSDLARATEVELSAIRGNDGGKIRIGAGQMWSWLFIPKIVGRFSEAFNSVSLEITTGPMHDLIGRLRDGKLDVIVGDFDGVKFPEGFHMQHAWSPEFRAFAAANHPLAQSGAVFAHDLVRFPWAGYIDNDVFEDKLNFWCRKMHVDTPSFSVKTTSLATLMRLTSAGNNIAILPGELETEAQRWGLVRLKQQNFHLWNIRTGSIVEERRASVKQYRYLLDLFQLAGSTPSEFISTHMHPH